MKKLILVDDETNEEVILATNKIPVSNDKSSINNSDLNKFYCILEDVDFYYNDIINTNEDDTNRFNNLLQIIMNKTSDFLYKNQN